MEHNTILKSKAICFGEVLWDMLPGGPQPGGAPLNVAYHLTKLGINSSVISKVGDDPAGKKLQFLLAQWGIGSAALQTGPEYATSEVLVKTNDKGEAVYEILYPVAWDFIDPVETGSAQFKPGTYFIYGSLASRNNPSKETLLALLEHDAINVFDINIREPFINKEVLQTLLAKADIAKFNQEELIRTSLMFGGLFEQEAEKVNFLRGLFNISEVIITRGSAGASYYYNDECIKANGPQITVADTVGSGDAFLAAFIAGRCKKESPRNIISNAVAMGAYIATKKGGCPEYQLPEFEKFKMQIL